ncbi:MAG: hypothetical protein JSV33_03275 [bacterium]|nr:MAG: hypothetical protein JSV33_03275 [bacterium]
MNKKKRIPAITTIIAILALLLSVYNTCVTHYKPAAMTIKVLGFTGPLPDVVGTPVTANLVFSNLGKRNIVIAGVLLKINDPTSPSKYSLNKWINPYKGEKTIPTLIPSQQTILKTIEFDCPQAFELEKMIGKTDKNEIRSEVIVTYVNSNGKLCDIYFDYVRFNFNARKEYFGYSVNLNNNTATLDDYKKGESILEGIYGSKMTY